MKLIDRQYNRFSDRNTDTFLANKVEDIPANINEQYPNSCAGSMIIVIESGAVYIKNTEAKWQKFGTSEVL